MVSYFKQHAKEEEWVQLKYANMPPPQTNFDIIDKIQAKLDEEKPREAMVIILEKKLEYYKAPSSTINDEQIKILNIVEYLIYHIPVWKKVNVPAEAFYLSHFSHIMEIILSNTALSLRIGEKASASTKQQMKDNQALLSEDTYSTPTPTNTVIGRKIDTIVKFKDDTELSHCEFKSKSASSQLLEQQTQALKTNECILFKMKEMGLNSNMCNTTYNTSVKNRSCR